MSGQTVLGALLRLLAIWFIYEALVELVYVLMKAYEIPTGSVMPVFQEKIFIAFYLACSVILIAGADWISALLYTRSRKSRALQDISHD